MTAECAVNAGQHKSESSCNSSKHVMVSNPVMSSQYGEEVILEAQTQTRLKLARGIGLAQEDLPKAGRAHAGIRCGKLNMVEGIEEFHAKVQREGLSDRDSSRRQHVPIQCPWASHIGQVSLSIAEFEGRRLDKRQPG